MKGIRYRSNYKKKKTVIANLGVKVVNAVEDNFWSEASDLYSEEKMLVCGS